MLEFPQIRSMEDESEFYELMCQASAAELGETRAAYRQALAALRDERGDEPGSSEELEISSFLDSFFSQRVGLHFLVDHYIASKQPKEGFAGLIQTDCSPVGLIKDLSKQIEESLKASFGASPVVQFHGDESDTFSFVPSHIEFVVGEVLRNAMHATVKHHLQKDDGRLTDLPPVKVIVAASDKNVNVKVADTAGGIPRSQLRNLWSYHGKALKRWGQGVGLGLPLARVFAKYFGGSVHTVPMEGYGTDCYVAFNRLAHENCENILKVPSFAAAARDEELAKTKESERPNQGKWRYAIRLFDAQARRRSVPVGEEPTRDPTDGERIGGSRRW